MYKEYYALMKETNGEKYYISRNDMNVLTDDVKEALYFFSESHISVWRKCNPTITNTITVKVTETENEITVTEI